VKLTIVIVNYNVKYFLEQCLISVERAMKGIEAEVIVVDNASSDDSCMMVAEKFKWVRLIASSVNLGFSKGNNCAVQLATGEYVLLLNPDTVVAEDTFTKCLHFLDNNQKAGALGVHMIDGKGNFLPESKRGLPTPAVAFYKTFGLSWLFPTSKIFGQYHLGYLAENEIHEVEVLSGAFMILRKSVLDKIGLLDEAFFMYGEDIDLSYRVTKGGFKNIYFPDTTIIHYKGESTRKGSLNYVKVFYNAMIIFAKKHFSGNQSGLFSFFINFAIVFRGFLTLLAGLFSSAYLFLVDSLLSFTGIYLIKTYWENMIKYTDHYYPNQFLFVVVPIYILIWIISTFLSGGYDKPFRISNIIKGIFFGTIAIAAVYAFLPNEWRFSRAMIMLGAAWTGFEMMFTRTVYHLIRFQSFSVENDADNRVIIAGSMEECQRAEKLFLAGAADSEIAGTVTDTGQLKKLAGIYEANEIIFCSRDIAFSEIIKLIITCGNRIDYKILNGGSDAFIGSNSKNAAGELYSLHHHLNLAKPAFQRRKRLLDIVFCLAVIPAFPLFIFVLKNRSGFLRNWFDVLTNKKTWVGYGSNIFSVLPTIKNAVISVSDSLKQDDLSEEIIARLNLLYARHYTVGHDLKLILKNFSELGK
jgi:O-antigen biosynthesis protein